MSADATHVLAGTSDRRLQIHDLHTGDMLATYTGHTGPVGCVQTNPKYDVVASACVGTALWTHAYGAAGGVEDGHELGGLNADREFESSRDETVSAATKGDGASRGMS